MRRWLLIFGLLLIGANSAFSQPWPNKPIKVVVPFSAGSAVDLVARTVMEQVSAQLGQPIVVENRVGAGGTIGVGSVAKAEPDGYTLLVHSTTHVVTASTYSNPGYDVRRDFAAITGLASLPNVLVVPPNKYKTLKDLVDEGKAKQGAMNYASGGAGSASHLNAERFLAAAGFKAQHIPFKGGPEALADIMADRVQFYFVPLPPARGLYAGGKVGILAVSGTRRSSALPEIPTTVEAGFPNSEYNFWVGMFAPAATPKVIVDRLNTETVKALATAGVREKLKNVGGDPMPMSSAEFTTFVNKETDINAALVKAAGVKIN
ncbi:MAG TPA: tripartite tricarboxylate transporter substrate binding protein [Xanthobacteraceae bacterium]|nr:tripartite tricarboxylate transporter substrate binding protein [Xanthobacteraceae bacterium]